MQAVSRSVYQIARHARQLCKSGAPPPSRSARGAASRTGFQEQGVTGVFPFQSVCRATIVGRTGAVPDHKVFGDGNSSLMFSVAVNEKRYEQGRPDADVITQWMRVIVADSVPGFDSLLRTLQPGSLVYVDGNLKVRKKSNGDQPYSEFVNVMVSRAQGTFRVLSKPQGEKEHDTDSSEEDEWPF